ncbi:hypothetical protein BJV78DRAFT_1285017 [Lactifluus subvellereus]|nr:hypothetical protein BJV78DRAFT_1285017 [Lactifluus subvellereus]
MLKQRKLLEERDGLISQIQNLQDFQSFLTASSFDTLRSAGSCGLVIIINHTKWRSDILIPLHHSPPLSLQPTISAILSNGGTGWCLLERNNLLESKQYQKALRSVLEALYQLVGPSVIKDLRKSEEIPEQSDPIPSDDGAKLYFSDLYISSYTPTLFALIESHKCVTQALVKPPILLVAQPDESQLQAREKMQVVDASIRDSQLSAPKRQHLLP